MTLHCLTVSGSEQALDKIAGGVRVVPQWLSFYQGPTNGPLGLLPAGTFFGRLGRSSHLDSHTPTRFHNERKATEKKMFLPHGLYNGLWWFSFLVHAKLLASADSCSLWGRGTLIKMGLEPLWYEPQWKKFIKIWFSHLTLTLRRFHSAGQILMYTNTQNQIHKYKYIMWFPHLILTPTQDFTWQSKRGLDG